MENIEIPSSVDVDGRTLMLELQVDELQSLLVEADRQRKSANYRASCAEKRNRKLKEKIQEMEADRQIILQCWGCSNLGNHACCETCTNRSVFEKLKSKGEVY